MLRPLEWVKFNHADSLECAFDGEELLNRFEDFPDETFEYRRQVRATTKS